MSFKNNLIKARSHIVFLAALICGLGLIVALEKRMPATANSTTELDEPQVSPMQVFQDLVPLPLAPRTASAPRDLAHAEIAWRYFENNTNDITGLVNSVDGYPSTTMWETGSYFVAITSAHRLGLIDQSTAEARLTHALATLAEIRLFDDLLPNKAYHVGTGELVDYANQPMERGLGWSALDIARIVATFGIIERNYPTLAPNVAKVLERWDLGQMVEKGQLIGGNLVEGALRRDQEGRVGYEQYAAKAMMLYGFDMAVAYSVENTLMVKPVLDQPIPVDNRLHRNVTPAFVVSEPYLFDGLEFGFDSRSHNFASAIFAAQEARWSQTGTLTAVTESHLDQSPYFIYSSVWGGGAPWAVLSFQGERLDSKRTVSTKAAFAWDALFGTEYTKTLVDAVSELGDEAKGFREGIYEIDGAPNKSITANTNAVVLAALSFKAHGPLLRTR